MNRPRELAVASDPGQNAFLCDTARGGRLAVLSAQTDRGFCTAFSPDGKLLATGSGDGTVKVWNLDEMRKRKGPVIWIGEKSARKPPPSK